jgi:glucan phosphoethanolaminetransferase (alkaline phosphatase superfamily)
VPHGRADNSSAIVALVCNIVATLICCNVLCIGGIVTSAIALNRAQTDPHESQNLVKWSWVILGVSIALQILLLAVLMMIGVFSENTSGYDSDGI